MTFFVKYEMNYWWWRRSEVVERLTEEFKTVKKVALRPGFKKKCNRKFWANRLLAGKGQFRMPGRKGRQVLRAPGSFRAHRRWLGRGWGEIVVSALEIIAYITVRGEGRWEGPEDGYIGEGASISGEIIK